MHCSTFGNALTHGWVLGCDQISGFEPIPASVSVRPNAPEIRPGVSIAVSPSNGAPQHTVEREKKNEAHCG
jgi:hypothetical protein